MEKPLHSSTILLPDRKRVTRFLPGFEHAAEKDCLKKFDYIRLELKVDGQFVLSYRENDGKKQAIKGTYEYDSKNECVQLKMGVGGIIHRNFPLKEGVIYITIPFKMKSLALQFEQK